MPRACPDGADEADNVVVRVVGTPAKRDFDVVAHDVWATEKGLLTRKEQPSSPGFFGLSRRFLRVLSELSFNLCLICILATAEEFLSAVQVVRFDDWDRAVSKIQG